ASSLTSSRLVAICRPTRTDTHRQAAFERFRYPGNAGRDHVTAKLTALGVKNAKPRRNRHGVRDRTWYPDGDGMYLVVQPAGAKSFALRYRFGGRTRNLKLGDAAISEEEARNGASLPPACARPRLAISSNKGSTRASASLRRGRGRTASRRWSLNFSTSTLTARPAPAARRPPIASFAAWCCRRGAAAQSTTSS